MIKSANFFIKRQVSDCSTSTVSDTESTKCGTTSSRSDSKSARNCTKDTRKGTTNS